MSALRAVDLGITLPALATDKTYDAVYAKTVEISPMIRRVLARNPNAFTFHGTGTYIIGRGRVAIIERDISQRTHFLDQASRTQPR